MDNDIKTNTQHNVLFPLPLILSSWLLNGSKQNNTQHKHTANKNMRSKNSCNNSKQQKTLCIDEIKTLTHKTNHWKETES